MEDQEIKTALSQIYRFLADQRQSHFELQKVATATFQTLRLVPGFAQPLYEQEWDAISEQLDRPHAEAMLRLRSLAELFEV
ncbi:MAG TPA: hypothetical protein VHZ07_20500 [Bryobacteraceae bacterium]|jgi:hypothetical protein|nr:hypothetical protein [Bryobacteraceae bacterium]